VPVLYSDAPNGIHIPCNRLIIQYLMQQIAQSVINNHLSLMFLVHVSTSTRSSGTGDQNAVIDHDINTNRQIQGHSH
jgi:hypothetical protein